ncbi:MAG: ribosome-associated translation inhibitor RaiA [Candidatus Paceibacterota bacterium]|jgi:putative sigma-54 modulation protein
MIKHHVKATSMELTPAISDYLDKKLSVLEKFVDEKSEAIARIEVGRTTGHHHKGDVFRAEITLDVEGKQFRAEAEAGDLYAAIDMMKDDVVQEVTRAGKKKKHLLKRGHQKVKDLLRKWKVR